MGIVNKFEDAVQGFIEGSFGRVFRTRLQPVELARKLERAMENNLTISSDRRVAPTYYLVHLSTNDYNQFRPMTRDLARQLADSLIAVARQRGYTLNARPMIQFAEDAHLITGQTHIDTHLQQPEGSGEGDTPGTMGAVEDTRALSQDERNELDHEIAQAAENAGPTTSLPPAWLTVYRPQRGAPMRLDRSIIHLGRHESNDVIVSDRRVSRFHAEIRFEHGQFVLYDLGSTNGVRVNGVPMRQPVPLRNNDIVGIGEHEFVFQRR